ncbi:MAG TPA: PfkB family carbohydrate kinase [Phycisphaerae bacterium]|nr:PfkB family carbohydrate kinase [Phycisphaerae bacterium]
MDALCFGSIIVDHRRRADAGAGDEPLRIVERAVDLSVGGVPILAAGMKELGLDVGLMGCVGRDIAGYGLKAYLAGEIGLDVEGVRMIDAPTSSSFIRLTSEQRWVDHTPGAAAELDGGEDELALVADRRPALMAIGYAGLLPRLDADGGAGMARWIRAVRELGTIVALDTHTVPPYAMLEKPVPVADVFVCNREEAAGITGLVGGTPEQVLAGIWRKYPQADPARPRLMGVAMPEGVQLALGRGESFASRWTLNPHYGTFAPADLTGAGDRFRAGLYAEILRHRRAFAAGRLDLDRAALAGHEAACAYLRRDP